MTQQLQIEYIYLFFVGVSKSTEKKRKYASQSKSGGRMWLSLEHVGVKCMSKTTLRPNNRHIFPLGKLGVSQKMNRK